MKTGVIVVQAASGRHERLLRLTEAWHRAYCQRHSFEYVVHYGSFQHSRRAVWDKIILLIAVLRRCAPGTVVVWIDADALIERPLEDIAAALPAGADVGMVRSLVGELNAGVVWIRTTARTLAWLERVQELGPLDARLAPATPIYRGALQEQTRMNRELATFALNVAEIDPRFNAYRWAAGTIGEPAVIRAWHASPLPYRLHRMQQSLELIKPYYPL